MSPAVASGPAPRQGAGWVAALLFGLTLALTWRTGDFAFVNYDDDVYVTENPGVLGGLSGAGLRWAFTSAHAANWHPLTWLSHQLDVTCFGLDAGAHHRTSALLHALAAALCFLALRALTGAPWKSALVAAFFALHPLRAESVAWVAERKDVLSGVFALGALWSYAVWTRRGGRARYAVTALLLALGLLAKPMLVTLPFLFLVLDAWPLRRLHTDRGIWRRRVLEKAPLFALVGLSMAVTFLVQRAGGAVHDLATIGFGARLANALQAVVIYAGKILWPSRLAAFHPHPALAPHGPGPWGAATGLALAAIAVAIGGAWRLRRRVPALAVGLAWFLGLLVPVIGLVQVGVQSWAGRYTYLPSIGFLLALVWGVEALLPAARRRAAGLAGALLLVPLSIAAARQIDTYRDSRTLFAHALEVTRDNDVAHTNLGQALELAGDLQGAREHYQAALELRPRLAPVRVGLGRVLRLQGHAAEARAALTESLRQEPDSAAAHAELGWLAYEQGADGEALEHLRRALELAPDDPRLQNNLAWALATGADGSRAAEALALADRLCAASAGRQPGFLETRAAALARLGRFDEAVEAQTRALGAVPAGARPLLRERLRLYREGKPFVREPPDQR